MTTERLAGELLDERDRPSSATLTTSDSHDAGMLALQYGIALTAFLVALLLAGIR